MLAVAVAPVLHIKLGRTAIAVFMVTALTDDFTPFMKKSALEVPVPTVLIFASNLVIVLTVEAMVVADGAQTAVVPLP